jgi:polyphosphate kinase
VNPEADAIGEPPRVRALAVARAPDARTAPISAADRPSRFINRELSWLDFNERVIAIAEDPSAPLLERVKFLSIFSANLDQFFQIRVSGLRELAVNGSGGTSPDGLSPYEQLAAIRARVRDLVERVDRLYRDEIEPRLGDAGIAIVSTESLEPGEADHVERWFDDRVLPVLTPLAVDPSHPFPYISDLSLNLAVVVMDPETHVRRFARVKVPPLLPRFLALPGGRRFLPIEDAIGAHLDELFPGMEVSSRDAFRVTRDADLDVDEDDGEDVVTAIESGLRRRRRDAAPVRLELQARASSEILKLLLRELELTDDDVYRTSAPLDLSALSFFTELDRPDLKRRAWTPVTPPPIARHRGIFRAIDDGDILVHLPYHSFSRSVEAFVEQAARDPDVLAIKQTLYRTSSQESPIIRALIRAAEAGKEVVALVELMARFDEEANLSYARALEEAGVHVVYGVVGLKTHAKISLVVRKRNGGIKRYAHVGTGNYNPQTAKLYEDLGLLTADPDIGEDLADLFNVLTGYSRQREYRKLLVAPHGLRSGLIARIEREAAADDGSIVMKMNSLADRDMIDALYAASQAGADVELIVRGICCLRPGVPELSERIHVRSLVGRYLEHARVFRFGSEARGFDHLIGSADLMVRNLDRRVEALAPVEDPALRAQLDEVLDIELADDVLAWTLGPDGAWTKVPTLRGVNAQEELQRKAEERAGSARG